MSDPRNYLAARGLADTATGSSSPPPFQVDFGKGTIVTVDAQPEGQAQAVGLPDDYAARLAAADFGTRLRDGLEDTKVRVRWFHAFLMGTDVVAPEPPAQESSAQERTFTDG